MFDFKKLTGFLSIAVFLSFLIAPVVKAESILDEIKTKLEGEGITVVDYSSAEGNWGSLTPEWIALLSKEGYKGIEELASVYENHFVDTGSITEKRRELAIAEAEKTGLTLQSEITEKNNQIAALQNQLDSLIADLQDDLVDEVSNFDFKAVGMEDSDENIEKGVNLLSKEIDFYYNYNKWGPLPLRVVGVIEQIKVGNELKYKSLQDMADQHNLCSADQEAIAQGVDEIDTFFSQISNFSAADVEMIKNSAQITCASGEAQVNKIAEVVADAVQNIAGGLAVLWIVIAGLRMIFAQGDETIITEQKRALLYGVIGLIVILLVGRLIDVLYGPAGVNRTELISDEGFNAEVYGIVSFIKAFVGIIAILFIVISGIRTIFAQGDEAEITNQRKSLLWIAFGLILIAINRVIVENLFIQPTQEQSDRLQSSNIAAIINTFANVLKFILGFVGLITFGILIYGAATMIMNYGDPEMVEKSKKIIKNAIIGIIIILSAYVIVASLVVFG